jgi:hypothetical protein
MPLGADMVDLLQDTDSAKAILLRMVNVFHLAISISPIIALLPRQFNNEQIRRDRLITVCQLASCWVMAHYLSDEVRTWE